MQSQILFFTINTLLLIFLLYLNAKAHLMIAIKKMFLLLNLYLKYLL